jgi:hypothetical protein
MPTSKKQISPERRFVYYLGLVFIVSGFALFGSTFVTFITNFGNFDNFEGQAISGMARAFGGIALIVVGGILMNVGARGIAGSGIILDPESARRDVEPWSRMAGGVVQDALSEINVVQKLGEDREPHIKVRCRKCQALNDEAAKFCNQCGAEI